MRWFLCLLLAVTVIQPGFAQDIIKKLKEAVRKLESDSQMRHALLGFYVVDDRSGELVLDHHGEIGMAPASCQKLITSVAALDLLGPDYRYKTLLQTAGKIQNGTLEGDLIIQGNGDPSLGSWRWPNTTDSFLMREFSKTLLEKGIKNIIGDFVAINPNFESQNTPGGWIWDDIGNYYGAGAGALNWHENQYDLYLQPGASVGDSVKILKTVPALRVKTILNELKTGPRGSGDNGYIFCAPDAVMAAVRGTVPLGENPFIISGSFPDGSYAALMELSNYFQMAGIKIKGRARVDENKTLGISGIQTLALHSSPTLDSINYWFLKRSINLYGECLLKTMALEKSGFASTEKGIDIVQDFWDQHGIGDDAINIMDGSGLSPQNRVTPHSLVQVLQYARTRPWFTKFYDALPEINNLHMKSGSIGGARSYAGYVQSSSGRRYSFAIIVNNHTGSSATIVKKMWKILDTLK